MPRAYRRTRVPAPIAGLLRLRVRRCMPVSVCCICVSVACICCCVCCRPVSVCCSCCCVACKSASRCSICCCAACRPLSCRWLCSTSMRFSSDVSANTPMDCSTADTRTSVRTNTPRARSVRAWVSMERREAIPAEGRRGRFVLEWPEPK